jgi:hypothetical protein
MHTTRAPTCKVVLCWEGKQVEHRAAITTLPLLLLLLCIAAAAATAAVAALQSLGCTTLGAGVRQGVEVCAARLVGHPGLDKRLIHRLEGATCASGALGWVVCVGRE